MTIGGSPATSVTFGSSTSLTAVTPSGTVGSTWVNITNGNGGTVNTTRSVYVCDPADVHQHHSQCRHTGGGQLVTITGTGFGSGTSLAVTIGGNPATSVTFGSSTSLTAVTPSRHSRIHLGQYHQQ